MTIKQQGGIFGRNPTFNDVDVDNSLTVGNDLTVTDDLTIGSNVLYVDAGSGNVGINTNSPNLHGWTKALTVNTTTNTAIELSRDGVKKGAFALQGDDRIQITSFEADPVQLRTANADRLVVSGTGDGDVTISTGNLVIGTSGKGIDFSATSGTGTSELFDDYEEGTWTPVYTPETGSFGSLTMDVITATYTKIGRTVVANCSIRTDDVDTTGITGNLLTITGLPFASASSHNVACSISNASQWAGDTPLSAIVSSSSTTVFLMYRTLLNGADNYLLCGDMTSGTNADKNRLILTAVYEAA